MSESLQPSVTVQTGDFDVGAEYAALTHQDTGAGAVVFFVGRVRDMNLDTDVSALTLEHYPGMTEKALTEIVDEARERWRLLKVRVIHRVGRLTLGDQIVLVGVTSQHREDAFAAAQFLMDYLKTRAPFWKKEETDLGERWIEALEKDRQAAKRW
ncbi:molybdopterin synthase catalytic subunit MoaE [Marinimicrobium alkaliphilum]|uniref:molybdopterin synthase catalytic subunit MoaE n=1 Tax=Marinimicrobium alkaliphilum TaxID=2202654 RepID=UPI0022B795B1|nr:molybdopterin synthase catalytic subunit MoaE [Marinimicrobium alkaliphilum]